MTINSIEQNNFSDKKRDRHHKYLSICSYIENVIEVGSYDGSMNILELRKWYKLFKNETKKFDPKLQKTLDDHTCDYLLNIMFHNMLTKSFSIGRMLYDVFNKTRSNKSILLSNIPGTKEEKDVLSNMLSNKIDIERYGAAIVFVLNNKDYINLYSALTKTPINTEDYIQKGFQYNGYIFINKDNIQGSPTDTRRHEYQHYLQRTFGKGNHDKDRIKDELLAQVAGSNGKINFLSLLLKLVDDYSAPFTGLDITYKYESSPDNMFNIHLTRLDKDLDPITDKGTLNRLSKYNESVVELVNIYVALSELCKRYDIGLDTDKLVILLGITSPHYRKDLLRYYESLKPDMPLFEKD